MYCSLFVHCSDALIIFLCVCTAVVICALCIHLDIALGNRLKGSRTPIGGVAVFGAGQREQCSVHRSVFIGNVRKAEIIYWWC